MGDPLKTEIRHHVATVTLDRPEVHNAFDDALIARLTATLRALEADADVRVVVLAAAGKSFSAGADLNWMRRMAEYDLERNLEDARGLAELMRTLDALAKPTVARVQGAAIGGGVGLVACCDIAIAATTASFALSEVKLGLIPAVIGPYVMNVIDARWARRYIISAERFDAEQARRIGLVHEVVPPADLDSRIDAVLETLSANGPAAMAAAKDLVRRVGRGPIDGAMIDDTARRIAAIRAGDEAREGLAAFLGKRKPGWIEG